MLFNRDDTALLLFAAEGVLQNQLLIRRYAGGEADERSMGVERQSVRAFVKGFAELRKPIGDDRNTHGEPFAAALSGPVGWRDHLRLSHMYGPPGRLAKPHMHPKPILAQETTALGASLRTEPRERVLSASDAGLDGEQNGVVWAGSQI